LLEEDLLEVTTTDMEEEALVDREEGVIIIVIMIMVIDEVATEIEKAAIEMEDHNNVLTVMDLVIMLEIVLSVTIFLLSSTTKRFQRRRS
jgi:SNF family Na+-dependent transporter